MWPRARKKYSSSRDPEWLIVGLANPGERYRNTPHNVGGTVVEALADAHRIPMVSKHEGLFGVGEIAGTDVALLIPLTYMNLSGRSVKPALKVLGLPLEKLLIVHDEIDLDFGRLQVKSGGGLAGHNGLKSISEMLGSRDFQRIRIGVGRPRAGDHRPISDWILAPWYDDLDVAGVVNEARGTVESIVENGLRSAIRASNK